MRSRILRTGLTAAALLGALGAAGVWRRMREAQRASGSDAAWSKTGGRYADPQACEQCHGEIAATYGKTGMGRSFRRVRREDIAWPAGGKPWRHGASDSFFEMVQRDGVWFQRRWQIGFDGKQTNVDEKRVDYVLGSGNHARTFLHLTEKNTLQELPLGWYAEKGGYWAMNPGYDRPDYAGSVRPIYYECMFCHNGYPKIPEGEQRDATQATYLTPLPEGIDCQRCHGPGQDHVDKAYEGASVEAIRLAIVNPARLPPDRRMEVCLQCHLETTNEKLPHAIVRFDRLPFSYTPGQPLGDYEVIFNRAQGNLDNFEVAQAGYRLLESQCFRKSAGKLECIGCHNPHDIPRGEQATAHYNQVCMGCHQEVTRAASAPHTREANCTGCHMPKRRTDDGIHVVMTDHLIARRPPAGDLLAEKTERAETQGASYQGEVALYYPAKLSSREDDDLIVAVAQVREQSNLKAGLPLLASRIEKHHPARASYYAELAEGYAAAGDTASAVRYFEEAARRDPASPSRLIQWGDALGEAGQWPLAEEKLRRATELAPDDARAWGRLGWAMWQQNKAGEAKGALEKAIRLGPEIAELHNNLGLVLWGVGDRSAAEKEFRAALRIQPGVAEWRLNLGRALASQGQLAEARFQMEQSLRLKPGYAEARADYARVLTDLNRPAEAEKQARLAVEADPRSGSGHQILGELFYAKADLLGAGRELSEAVQLQPGNWRAQVELGIVLARQGDRRGAVQHLTAAAQGPDPDARAAAEQALRELR
ncbi:MAG TPA: tetratricopeptide repeat protein [Bryobacteraceae bacterium]|nr:tetratricopeptide repeat protein [Bryobacteraceae bacterium]